MSKKTDKKQMAAKPGNPPGIMDKQKQKKLAILAVGATGACVAAIILLVRSALTNKGEPDTLTTVIAVFLMGAATVIAFWVKRKRKEAIEHEKNPPPEPIDEEWEALLDHFYDMDREEEFYTCLESGGPIDYVEDYEDAVEIFEEAKSEAQAAGSAEYIWRTSKDNEVCLRCRRLNGRRYAWDNPPRGGHPGCAPGCRCEAEPVLPAARPRPAAPPKARQAKKSQKSTQA